MVRRDQFKGSTRDPFLTAAEVADLQKVTAQTVRDWIGRGELEAIRVGRFLAGAETTCVCVNRGVFINHVGFRREQAIG